MKMDSHDALLDEISKERAEALGRTERKLRSALKKYHAMTAAAHPPGQDAKQERAFWELVESVTSVIVQREACGLRDPDYVYAFYGVPPEVAAQVGAKPSIESGSTA